LVEIGLPKGKGVMEAFFFMKAEGVMKPEIKVPLPPEQVEAPFTPIFLPGRTQITKAILCSDPD
jgi:hypothetical protein